MAAKLTYQNQGSNWAVFINGETEEEITRCYYSLWNWKATSGDLFWMNGARAYIWSTKARLEKYFENIYLMELIDNRAAEFKGKRFGALPVAKEMAAERLEGLQQEKLLTFGGNYETFALGSISAEKPDLDLKDYFLARSFKS